MKFRKLSKKFAVLRMTWSWVLVLIPLFLFLVSIGLHVNRWPLLPLREVWKSSQDSLGDIKYENEDLEHHPIGNENFGDFPIRDYFEMLKKPTGVCRKLVRFGGNLVCRMNPKHRRRTNPILDGDKLICVDPEMKMFSSPNTDNCTVLSFGISTDTSFDEDIRDANCQVHMFDVWDYDPSLNDTFMTFHKIGLSDRSEYVYSPKLNYTVEMNTLNYIVDRFHLSSKLINVLKIDIEGSEWSVLSHLTKNNLLNSVGQIAVEVHADQAINVTKSIAEKRVRKFQKVLLNLEEAGFRRVVYWDNERAVNMKDEKGVEHKHAGELLLVNYNWYKKKLKKKITSKD